jgi:hypothetical protein
MLLTISHPSQAHHILETDAAQPNSPALLLTQNTVDTTKNYDYISSLFVPKTNKLFIKNQSLLLPSDSPYHIKIKYLHAKIQFL